MTGMPESTLYRAEGLEPIVSISDGGPLLETLGDVMLGWNIVPATFPQVDPGSDNQTVPEAVIRIEQGADGWTCTGETFDEPITYADPVATACALIAAIYKAHTLADLEGLFFHAAGVRVGSGANGGLVLLTGHYRAGKSVVTTACAAAGLQVFSDDIIPLDPGGRVARAPGLAIRLRLPIPDGFWPETREFVETHRIASSERYAYIRPPANMLAQRNEALPIRAMVALRRTEGAPARLSHLRPGDALSETIRRNFAREVPAGRILDVLDGLIGEVPCFSLAYGSAEDAASLLHDTFEGALHEIDADQPVETSTKRRKSSARPLSVGAVIHRSAGAHARERDGQAFLTDAEELVIFHLNATGTAIWRLLEQPAPFGEISALFAAGFPDHKPNELTADLSRLIRDLAASGLVRIEAG